jgi:C-terminal peptidase prc
MACQTVMQAVLPSTITPIASSTWTIAPTGTPTWTPTWTPTPSKTPIPPSATPSTTPAESPTPAIDQLDVFQQLWQAVKNDYLYPDFNGLDWSAVREEYQKKIQAGMSDLDFYKAMHELIDRLGDDHSAFFSPQEAAANDARYQGNYDYVGIGVMTSPIPDRKRVTIIGIFPNSPAEQAGLKLHDSILSANGHPIMDEQGYRRDLILGPEGSTVTLTVQSPGEVPREIQVTRRHISGMLPVPYEVLTTPKGKRIGYLLLITFNDRTVVGQVEEALRSMSAEAPLEGVIIDNRFNSGGMSDVLGGMLGFFTQGTAGYFVRREEKFALKISPVDVGGSQQTPLVVMVSKNTVSFGEIFAGILRDLGRAYIVGETSAGNVEVLRIHDFSDGSRAWIAFETFHPLNHPDQIWEKTGIVPDQGVASDWDQVNTLTDPAVQAALAHFDTL